VGEITTIGWTDHTFNIVEGCAKVSEGCLNCYAWGRDKRFYHGEHWGHDAPHKKMSPDYWKQPLKWNLVAELNGVRHRVFCSSLADVFEDHPTNDEERPKLWELIRKTPNLDWQILSKRPENFKKFFPPDWSEKATRMSGWV
jgi:protein gp37